MFVMIMNETFFNCQKTLPKEFLDETKKLWEPLLGRTLNLAEVQMLIEQGLGVVDWLVSHSKADL